MDTDSVSAGEGSIAMKFDHQDGVMNLRIRNPRDHTQLSSREHELIADSLLNVLLGPGIEFELDEIRMTVEMSEIDSPWLWHPQLNIESTDLQKLDFIRRKCPHELNFEDFMNALEMVDATRLEENSKLWKSNTGRILHCQANGLFYETCTLMSHH